MSAKKTILMSVMALVICSTVMADLPGSTTLRNASYFTINRHNDAHYNGAKINLWEINHNPSQDWGLRSDNTIHSAVNSAFCLNLHNNEFSNGATINLWECNGHDSQKWIQVGATYRPIGDLRYCLNLHNYDNTNDATINLWECNGHASQNWYKIQHTLPGESN